MKHLLEFAKFRDLTKSKDDEINMILNQPFRNNESLLSVVHLRNNKDILIKWFNTTEHPMIERIKERTSFNSTSEFNIFTEKVIKQFFDVHFDQIDKPGRYALYMLENGFNLIIDISYLNYQNLFSTKFVIINIITLVTSPANDTVYKKIVINDEDF